MNKYVIILNYKRITFSINIMANEFNRFRGSSKALLIEMMVFHVLYFAAAMWKVWVSRGGKEVSLT